MNFTKYDRNIIKKLKRKGLSFSFTITDKIKFLKKYECVTVITIDRNIIKIKHNKLLVKVSKKSSVLFCLKYYP